MFIKRPKITKYFEENHIPAFKAHGSIWVLKAAGIPSAEMGITNNLSESINAVLHTLLIYSFNVHSYICYRLSYVVGYTCMHEKHLYIAYIYTRIKNLKGK